MKNITINDKLLKIRNIENLSQNEFAKRLGVKQSYYSELERGKRNITTKIITSLSKEFNISSDWLLSDSGQMYITNSDISDKDGSNKIHLEGSDFSTVQANEIAVINADDFEKKQAGKMGGDFVTGLSQNDRKKINVESDGLPEISDKEHENSNLFMKNEQTDINEANRKNPDESLFNPYTNKTYRQFLYYDKMSINQLNLSYEAEYMLFKESYITRKKLLEVVHFIQPANFILEQFPLLPDFDLYFKALSEQWDKHFNTLIYNDILLTVKIMELKASREGEIMLLTKLINYLHMYQDMLTSSNNLKNKDITGQ
jgi:transcriptional regulator with XRE-family HTH domain